MLTDTPAPWAGGATEPDGQRAPLSVRRAGDRTVVEVTGEIDSGGAEQLQRAVVEATVNGRPAQVVVDLTGLSSLDTGGVNALVAGREAAVRAGVPLRLTRARPEVRRSLAAAGLAALHD